MKGDRAHAFLDLCLCLLLLIAAVGCEGRGSRAPGARLMGAHLTGQPRAFEGLGVDGFDLLDLFDPSEVVSDYFPGRQPEAWSANDGTLSVVDDALELTVSGPDPQFVMREETTAAEVCRIEARFSAGVGRAEMFWTGRGRAFSASRHLSVSTQREGGDSALAVFVMDQPERLGRLRFDPSSGKQQSLRRVTLRRCVPRAADAWLPLVRRPHRVALGGDERSSLVMPPGVRHQWAIESRPGLSVRLSIGSSGGRSEEGIVFRATSVDGRTKHFETVLGFDPGTWRDYSLALDLPPQSGQVVLSFEMAGAEGIGYVANPSLSGSTFNPGRPDLVLISLDTSAARRFSLYGYPRTTSPNIDKYASRGLLFLNATSAAAYTLPSHAAMLSGLSPLQTQAIRTPVPPDVPLVAQLLSRSGYETVAITGGLLVSREWGFARGFNRFADGLTTELGRQVDEALDELGSARGSPLFVFLHSYAVHAPYRRTGAFSSSECGSVGDQVAVGPGIDGRGSEVWWIKPPRPSTLPARECVPDLYDDGIGSADTEVGRLLAAIAKRDRPTAVIFTSDHGEMLGEGGRFAHGWEDEQVARVPLVIWAPGLGAGKTSAMACGYDVAPTLLGLAGIEKLPSMSGVNLLDRSATEARSCVSFALLPEPVLTVWGTHSRASLPLTEPRPKSDTGSDADPLRREVDKALAGRQLRLFAGRQTLHVSASISRGFTVCLTSECGRLNAKGNQRDLTLQPGERASLGLVSGWTGRMTLVIEGHRFEIDFGQRWDRGFRVDGETVTAYDGPEKEQAAVRLLWPGTDGGPRANSTMTEQMRALGYIR